MLSKIGWLWTTFLLALFSIALIATGIIGEWTRLEHVLLLAGASLTGSLLGGSFTKWRQTP